MTKMTNSFLLLFCLFTTAGALKVSAHENHGSCSQMLYEHNNMVDYGPLRVSRIKGSVKDIQGVTVLTGCVGVFSDNGKRLIASTAVLSDGSFEIQKIPHGDYKLVVTVEGFCAPNAKIRVGRGPRSKQRLVAIMKPRGIDECSWIEAK